MNSVQILGNLARDPQVRATQTGKAMASFTVAINRNYTTPQGEQKEITDWVNVVAWGNLAEAVGNNLHKGSRCFVEGRFTTRQYLDQQGQKRWISEVNANFIAVPLVQKQNAGFGQGFNQQSNGFSQQSNNFGNFDQFGKEENIPF